MSVKSGQALIRPMDSAVGSPQTPSGSDMGLGLQAIYRACYRLYPDQPSPLQVTALRKFWMGGPDPLDYIYMFSNIGSADGRSPPHWHYVTNGLSDLYGDSRLHNCSPSSEGPSGFGFELTFRLRREPSEKSPPTWPAHLLQSLARYVFRSQAQLLPGDHIPWHCPLDQLPSSSSTSTTTSSNSSTNGAKSAPSNTTQQQQQQQQSVAMAAMAAAASLIAAQSQGGGEPIDPATYSSALAAAVSAAQAEYTKRMQQKQKQQKSQQQLPTTAAKATAAEVSKIRHMLLVDDPQLERITTPYGWVRFLQIVGLCDDELRLVQRWTGAQVADILRQHGGPTGGALLVTDMHRSLSIFELEPGLGEYINERMRREGSNLSGVTTQFFAWSAIDPARLGDTLPGEREAVSETAARRGNHPHAITAMDTDGGDSGSVTTLHPQGPPSSVTTAANRNEDEVIPDVAGDGSTCSSGVPKAKHSKNESLVDSEMRNETPSGNPVDDHKPIAHNGTTAFSVHSRINSSSASPQDILAEMRHRGGTSSAGGIPSGGSGLFARGSARGSSYLPGTPGSSIGGGGGDSAPCTPLAHLSLSPASLEVHPTRPIECLDVHFSLEAGELLPLAICDRLKHGRHFTFLNANSPEHAITLVPPGVTGAMVSPEVPFVSRGPWLQIYLPIEFLEQLERQFSVLQYPEDITLPLVFRWPEYRLRICVLDASISATSQSAQTQAYPPPPIPTQSAPPQHRPIPGSAPGFAPPLFPPGCVPPPPVLAAFFNSRGTQSPPSPQFIPTFPMGKPSPASAPHLPIQSPGGVFPPHPSHPATQTFPSAALNSPGLMEAMLASLSSFYCNKGVFNFTGAPSGFPPNSELQPPPTQPPPHSRPPW